MNLKFAGFLLFSLIAHILILSNLSMPKAELRLANLTPLTLINKKIKSEISQENNNITQKKFKPIKKPKKIIKKKYIKPIPQKTTIKKIGPIKKTLPIDIVKFDSHQQDEVKSISDNVTTDSPIKNTNYTTEKEIYIEIRKKNELNLTKYKQNIISKINHNISYPPLAQKRGLEGNFKVRLDITESGNINKISFAKENGSRILKKAILKGIENTRITAPGINIILYLPVEFRLID